MPLALVARVFDTQANQSFDKSFERFPVRIGRNQLNDLSIDRLGELHRTHCTTCARCSANVPTMPLKRASSG